MYLTRPVLYWWIIFSLLLLLAVVRIISTYGVFSQTYDEPAHIAAGLEWLERGTYQLEVDHPPLARVFNAVGPWLAGARPEGISGIWQEGNEILHSTGNYKHILALARAGTLPFFILAVFFIAWTSWKKLDVATALIAVVLFSTLPIVLGHAGLATNDMAVTATVFMALVSMLLWYENPEPGYGILAGLAVALALLSKFSAVVYLTAGGLLAVGWLIWQERGDLRIREKLAGIPVILLVSFFVLWGGYRFSIGPFWIDRYEIYNETINRYVGSSGTLHDLVYAVIKAPVYPAIEFVQGIIHVAHHNAIGHRSYFMGEISEFGWWNFFLVGTFVKTPLAFLALTGTGIVSIFSSRISKQQKQWLILFLIIAASFFLSTLTVNINIGIRHILPVFPFLSVIAAAGFMYLWRMDRYYVVARSAAIILLSGCLIASVRAHPDYFSYFNIFADDNPEDFLINSDLDWGQDLLRLEHVLLEKDINELYLVYFGSADIERFDLPPVKKLEPGQQARGWIAISMRRLRDDGSTSPPYDGYRWLEKFEPVERIGRSIYLYKITDNILDKTVNRQ